MVTRHPSPPPKTSNPRVRRGNPEGVGGGEKERFRRDMKNSHEACEGAETIHESMLVRPCRN